MLKFIFYAIGVCYLIYEILWITHPIERATESFNLAKLFQDNKGKKWDTYSQEYKDWIKSKFYLVIYVVWPFFGLFTFQWAGFLLFILINHIIFTPINRLGKNNKPLFIFTHFIHSFIAAILIGFLILNSYHLKLDVYKELVLLVS